jgi:hypothetical protein
MTKISKGTKMKKYEGIDYPIKCCSCGRFIKYSELGKGGGGSWCFVPMSDVSYEEDRCQCKACTEKHGPPVPFQNVVVNLCSGTF